MLSITKISILIIKNLIFLIKNIYLSCSKSGFGMKSVFMHNPIGFLSSRSSSFIEHQCLLHPDQLWSISIEDFFVFSRGFPVACVRRSICSNSGRVFSIPKAEKIPFFFSHFSLPCLKINNNNVNSQLLSSFHANPNPYTDIYINTSDLNSSMH